MFEAFSLTRHGDTSTNVEPSPIENPSNPDVRLVILPNCYADIRCASWLSALNNVTHIGCGINVLRFMGEMEESDAEAALAQAMDTGEGTPFRHVVDWFNRKLRNSGKDIQGSTRFTITENTGSITTIPELTTYFTMLRDKLPLNSCTIVKLNRDPDPSKRPSGSTSGHYVLMSKDESGKIWTYEPYLSEPGKCNKREYKGTVSQDFFRAYQSQGYISISLLGMSRTAVTIGGGGEEGEPFLIPEDIFNDFIKDIDNSTECKNNVSGGKTKRKRRTNKNKNNKNKTKRTYKHKQKKYKHRKYYTISHFKRRTQRVGVF